MLFKLVFNADHNGACLDDCVCGAAYAQTKFLDGSHGNVGRNDVAAADVNLDVAVDCTLGNLNYGALELVSCTNQSLFLFQKFDKKRRK